jgi:flagellar hook-length control protein FliK
LIDNGQIAIAEKLIEALEKGVKEDAELGPKIAEQKSRLASTELAQEREADKAFSTFVADVAKKKPFEDSNVKRAQQIATKHKGTKAAVRAERFVTLSKVKLEK